MKGVAMWMAVDDATIENGTMHMLPGLQYVELDHGRDLDSDSPDTDRSKKGSPNVNWLRILAHPA